MFSPCPRSNTTFRPFLRTLNARLSSLGSVPTTEILITKRPCFFCCSVFVSVLGSWTLWNSTDHNTPRNGLTLLCMFWRRICGYSSICFNVNWTPLTFPLCSTPINIFLDSADEFRNAESTSGASSFVMSFTAFQSEYWLPLYSHFFSRGSICPNVYSTGASGKSSSWSSFCTSGSTLRFFWRHFLTDELLLFTLKLVVLSLLSTQWRPQLAGDGDIFLFLYQRGILELSLHGLTEPCLERSLRGLTERSLRGLL